MICEGVMQPHVPGSRCARAHNGDAQTAPGANRKTWAKRKCNAEDETGTGIGGGPKPPRLAATNTPYRMRNQRTTAMRRPRGECSPARQLTGIEAAASRPRGDGPVASWPPPMPLVVAASRGRGCAGWHTSDIFVHEDVHVVNTRYDRCPGNVEQRQNALCDQMLAARPRC